MVTLHEVITFLVSMQISISSLQTHNVNRCGRSRHLARKLSLVVCFCHHEHKPAMNTTDPEIQALLTPTDAQSGFLADAWISCVRLQYFLLQHVLFGLLANPASS